MTEKIIIAGSGGQGIMLAGKVLAHAAMKANKHVTWMPAYGAEVRGGTAHCMVIISDEEIGSPYISKADSLIIMNAPSLERFKGHLKNKGLSIVNSSLAKEKVNSLPYALQCPFTDTAIKLGNIKVANIVALGYFLAKRKIISQDIMLKSIEQLAPSNKKELIVINQQAFLTGYKLASGEVR